jgi:hypothetical protein
MKMQSKYIIVLSGIIVFILLIVCICTSKKINKKDDFKSLNKNNYTLEEINLKNDPANDGKMKFGYLTSKDYGKKILAKYYTNDDTIYNAWYGAYGKAVYHPYQVKTGKLYGHAGSGSYTNILESIYQKSGNPAFQNMSKALVLADKEKSDYYYNVYGVRL